MIIILIKGKLILIIILIFFRTLDTNTLSKYGNLPANSTAVPINPYISTQNTANPLTNLNLMGLGYLPQDLQVPTSGAFFSNLNLNSAPSNVKSSPNIGTSKLPTTISTIKEKSKANLTDDDKKKKRRRRGTYALNKRNLQCQMCGATETPEWRRGPAGDHTLCNACGLHYAKSLKKQRKEREKDGRKHSIDLLLNANEPSNPNTLNPPVKSDSTSSDGLENKDKLEIKPEQVPKQNEGSEESEESDEDDISSPNSHVTPPSSSKDPPTSSIIEINTNNTIPIINTINTINTNNSELNHSSNPPNEVNAPN